MRTLPLLLLFACAAFAQVDTGVISGVVSDSSGAVIPGVHVQITQESTNIQLDLNTNQSGFFSAPALHPGLYSTQCFDRQARAPLHERPEPAHLLYIRPLDRWRRQ